MPKLICMSFEGEYQTERPTFKTTDDAWNYSDDLGSKWYFYPFHFVVSDSGKTVIDAPDMFSFLRGKRVKTVVALFNEQSKVERCQGMTPEQFALSLWGR